MLCRSSIALLLLQLSACKQVADVGGAALPEAGCRLSCGAVDAGVMSDTGLERPEASVASADAQTYEQFTRRLNGRWSGISAALNGPEETLGSRFEIVLAIEPGAVSGSFVVQCLDEPDCDPFGPDSARPDGGRLEIADLVALTSIQAKGKLRWANRFDYEAPFWDMERNERDTGAVLTFRVGFPGSTPESVAAYRVVLAEGPWPDGGAALEPDGSVVDAGPTDGGARDGAGQAGTGSDAGEPSMVDP